MKGMDLSIRGLGGLITLLSLPSVSSASRPNLASVDENSGIKVVFEYVTGTDCSNVCGSPPAATTFVTTIPQLCPTGWTDVAFTVMAPLSGHHPLPTSDKDVGPPPRIHHHDHGMYCLRAPGNTRHRYGTNPYG